MIVDVIHVTPLGGYRLRVAFDDGTNGEIDVSEIVELTGVFEPLTNPEYFARVRVEPDVGTICWPNGADLDPHVLYSRVTGRPIALERPVVT